MKNIITDETGLTDMEWGTFLLLVVVAFGILAMVIAEVPGG